LKFQPSYKEAIFIEIKQTATNKEHF